MPQEVARISKRLGILTGGGDCPGLNAAIRAVTRRSLDLDTQIIGIAHGWQGLIDGTTGELVRAQASGILSRGGTILGASGTNPYKHEGGVDKVIANFGELDLDALVAIGGEGTLGIATRLHRERGLPVVGLPKTIDNDVGATDYTVGFDTAVAICSEAIDRLHTTAESQDRVMVAEVMGRRTGWIAVHSGIAGGADLILIPEQPRALHEVFSVLEDRHRGGRDFSIVVVAEGCALEGLEGRAELDRYGHERLGQRHVGARLARAIEAQTGFESRVTVLGHVQRGGSPTARDRVLATRLGLKAADLAHEGRFGRMAALRGDEIVDVSLVEATAELKTVPPDWYAVAEAFFR